jgi:hypothetical protein
MKVISEGNKRVNITVLLDDKTLTSLRAYGFDTFGKTNVSQAIMSMVKEYERNNRTKKG